MRFLADMGVSMTTVMALRNLGHDASHLREQSVMRMEDPDIVAKARAGERTILTFDLDFGDIRALSGSQNPSVILFRLRNQTPRSVTPRLMHVVQECAAEHATGVFVKVGDQGYRIRRLPIGETLAGGPGPFGGIDFPPRLSRITEGSGGAVQYGIPTSGLATNETRHVNTALLIAGTDFVLVVVIALEYSLAPLKSRPRLPE